MKKIRVMIVEDSWVVQEHLKNIIDQDPRLEVVSVVNSGEEALRTIHDISPDVISLDIRLPGMNGFETTRKIMSEKPTPIVVVSASVESEDLKISMNALRAGALSVVEKPPGMGRQDYQSKAQNICTQLAIMSQVRVIRQRIDRNHDFAKAPSKEPKTVSGTLPLQGPLESQFHALGLVASTGGPNAILTLLHGLDKNFPLPIFLVQHISPGFLIGFVSWLNEVCPFPVTVSREGDAPKPAQIYVAPADRHLKIARGRLRIEAGPPVSQQCPSGTVLFQSMAEHYGKRAIGVLLTGMGDDGAEGLLDMRKAGGYTIAEDSSTAVVYGMPAEAVKRGAACESLPLPSIAPKIRKLVVSQKDFAL